MATFSCVKRRNDRVMTLGSPSKRNGREPQKRARQNGIAKPARRAKAAIQHHRSVADTRSGRFDAILFDADDTLWRTQRLYEIAKDQFEALCRRMGVWDSEVRERLDALDLERVKTLGLSPARFPGSMVETLRVYLAAHSLPRSKAATVRARQIGKHVFRKRASLQPGARSLLRRLRSRYRLILFTKGSRAVQMRRLRESGLLKYFDAVHVVGYKSRDSLLKLCRIEELTPSRVLVVGDSLRSDIKPALAIGATGVWIPAQSWRLEHGKKPRSKRFVELPALSDLPAIL